MKNVLYNDGNAYIQLHNPDDKMHAYKIKNPLDAPMNWEISTRKSLIKSGWLTNFLFSPVLYTESVEETIKLMLSLNGAGIVFSDIPYTSPYPNGIVYVNFEYNGPEAHGTEQLQRAMPDKMGYIGKVYQDGAKFKSTCRTTLIINRDWISKIQKILNINIDL